MTDRSDLAEKQFRTQQQTVLIGDSRRLDGIPDGKVNLFVTSPPYWNLKSYGAIDEIGQSTYAEYLADLNLVWSQCYRCAAPNSVLVVNVNSRRHKKKFYPIAMDIAASMQGWQLWDHVIWYIPNALPQPNHYMERVLDNKFESCLVFTKDGSSDFKFNKPRVPQKYLTADPRAHKKNANGRCLGNILRIPAYRPPNVKDLGYHIAAFPEELVAFFIECYTDAGDVVADPFLGSGTTLKVSRVMNRIGYGCEANADFAPLIRERILEQWEVPDWRKLDILHSATMTPGMAAPRKIQYRARKDESALF